MLRILSFRVRFEPTVSRISRLARESPRRNQSAALLLNDRTSSTGSNRPVSSRLAFSAERLASPFAPVPGVSRRTPRRSRGCAGEGRWALSSGCVRPQLRRRATLCESGWSHQRFGSPLGGDRGALCAQTVRPCAVSTSLGSVPPKSLPRARAVGNVGLVGASCSGSTCSDSRYRRLTLSSAVTMSPQAPQWIIPVKANRRSLGRGRLGCPKRFCTRSNSSRFTTGSCFPG